MFHLGWGCYEPLIILASINMYNVNMILCIMYNVYFILYYVLVSRLEGIAEQTLSTGRPARMPGIRGGTSVVFGTTQSLIVDTYTEHPEL